jgi:DNA repair exonuclease SbcCD ATPase subunit
MRRSGEVSGTAGEGVKKQEMERRTEEIDLSLSQIEAGTCENYTSWRARIAQHLAGQDRIKQLLDEQECLLRLDYWGSWNAQFVEQALTKQREDLTKCHKLMVESMKGRIEALERELAEERERSRAREEQLKQAEREVQQTKQELTATKVELQTKTTELDGTKALLQEVLGGGLQ